MKKNTTVSFICVDSVSNVKSDDSDERNLYDKSDVLVKTKSIEHLVDTFPMLRKYKISLEIINNPEYNVVITPEDYQLNWCECFNNRDQPTRFEQLEMMMLICAHLDQFPKPSSHFSASLPTVFAWKNINVSFSSEYPTTIQNYFKNSYNGFRQGKLKFYFIVAPSAEKFNQISTVRATYPHGRLLFHYIGYGFPTIEKDAIYCSDRRSTKFERYNLKSIFMSLTPPNWYIFDCSNAAVVLDLFKECIDEIADRNGTSYICMCATDVNEFLPDDPRLPKDFLTSCLLTPLRMAIICHVLQNFRTNIFGSNYPKEIPFDKLFSDKDLTTSLSAIIDAIAGDGLPKSLFIKLFRTDRSCAQLFRYFLLSQFLLRPYRVHPKSYPPLPDLSMHPLWKHWSVILDTAICSNTDPRPSSCIQLLNDVAKTMELYLRNNQIDMIKPYHLILLYYRSVNGDSQGKYLDLMAEYAAHPDMEPDYLTSAAIFTNLLDSMIKRGPSFHSNCFVVLAVLYYSSINESDIKKEIDYSQFPSLIFDESINLRTRILVIAVVANITVLSEKFQEICTQRDFLMKVKDALSKAVPLHTIWLLLLIRRSFHLYSPEKDLYNQTGLHIQVAVHLFSSNHIVRAIALSVLTCFMMPFECNTNGQLLLLSLATISDASYVVRFHFVLLLKKFITSIDGSEYSKSEIGEFEFNYSSYSLIFESCIGANIDILNGPSEEFFKAVDNYARMKGSQFLPSAHTIAIKLLKFYKNDSHKPTSDLAGKILDYVEKNRYSNKEDESDVYGEELEEESCLFADIDQNSSLHRMCLHNIIKSDMYSVEPIAKESEQKSFHNCVGEFTPNPYLERYDQLCTIDCDKVFSIFALSSVSDSVALAVGNEVRFIDSLRKFNDTSIDDNVGSIRIVSWEEEEMILFASDTGCVYLWNPKEDLYVSRFCADPSAAETHGSKPFVLTTSEPYVIYVLYSGTNYIHKWNIKTSRLMGEWILKKEYEVTSALVHPSNENILVLGGDNGSITLIKLDKNQLTVVGHWRHPKWESILDIMYFNLADDSFFVTVTVLGNIYKWKDLSYVASIIIYNKEVFSVGSNQSYPFILVSPKRSSPFMMKIDGNILHTFEQILAGALCQFHLSLPIFSFLVPEQIYSFRLCKKSVDF